MHIPWCIFLFSALLLSPVIAGHTISSDDEGEEAVTPPYAAKKPLCAAVQDSRPTPGTREIVQEISTEKQMLVFLADSVVNALPTTMPEPSASQWQNIEAAASLRLTKKRRVEEGKPIKQPFTAPRFKPASKHAVCVPSVGTVLMANTDFASGVPSTEGLVKMDTDEQGCGSCDDSCEVS